MRRLISTTGPLREEPRLAILFAVFLATAAPGQPAIDTGPVPPAQELEESGAIIGEVILGQRNIFDLSDPKENKWLYRWANRLHVVTKDRVIRKQLLFEPGDKYSARLLQESERIVRSNKYIFDAEIRPVHYDAGVVDVEVSSKDVWSLTPDISFSRDGGKNRYGIGIEETNLLGRGQLLRAKYVQRVERTSKLLDFEDRNLGSTWVSLFVRVADNSDGKTNILSVIRPFHAMDARWSAGGWISIDEKRTALYSLGEEAAEFGHDRDYFNTFGGWSSGLRNGWARRWSAGIAYDDNRFYAVPEPSLAALIPEDRKLVYPYLAVEILEDEFSTSSNTNQMGRTEDFFMGTRFAASLGWSSPDFGADRSALIATTSINLGFGDLDNTALLLSGFAEGRRENGNSRNAIATLNSGLYVRQSEKRLFFMKLSGTVGHDLDLDNPVELGGDSGLRGYPLRYQTGDSKVLFSIEQRYFTDWYPWRLFRVGGAVFADAGRTWGENPAGEQDLGWLRDVGFGLRFAPTRFSTDKIAHLDFAFPLDGDPSIDSVQILFKAKRSF